MKFEATAREIGTLLQLAEVDAQAQLLSPEAYRSRREAASRLLPRALLDRYERLLDGSRRPVIAAIERGACSGCHVRLPTMVEHAARRSPAVHTCPHCHRMLYAPELLQEAVSTPPSERKPGGKRAPGTASKART
jgi:hypothetical protein